MTFLQTRNVTSLWKNTFAMCLRHVPWDSGSTSQSPWKWTCWSPVASIKKSSDLFRGKTVVVIGRGSIPGKRNDVLNNSFLESWWHWRLGFLCLLLEHKTGPIYSDGIGWYWMFETLIPNWSCSFREAWNRTTWSWIVSLGWSEKSQSLKVNCLMKSNAPPSRIENID